MKLVSRPTLLNLLAVCFGLLVSVVLLEIVSLALYYHHNKEFFYTRAKAVAAKDKSYERPINIRLGPYFGFMYQRGNSHGFAADRDYPYHKKKGQFVIGVFGGSVAQEFTFHGKDRFVRDLKSDPYFRDREVVVLCFAMAGHKQPQQALILNYFLALGQGFDMVINIDGFNEMAVAYHNYECGIDISMPNCKTVQPVINLIDTKTMTLETARSLSSILGYKRRMNSAGISAGDSSLASEYYAWMFYYKHLTKAYAQELVVFDKIKSANSGSGSSLYSLKTLGPSEKGDFDYEKAADIWANSSIQMGAVLAGGSIPYIHFLQPNQYYSRYYSRRKFSEAEAEIAFNDASPYKEAAEKGYPYLIKKSEVFKRHNIRFINGAGIFDKEPRPVYTDNCCHYNELGNSVLADALSRAVLKVLKK